MKAITYERRPSKGIGIGIGIELAEAEIERNNNKQQYLVNSPH